MSTAAHRGQATVELALGTLLFVSILMLGMYLAETSFLSLKVGEAENFATWYGTGMRVHQFGTASPYSPWAQLPSKVQSEATTRYADFDGRSSTGGAGGIGQALSKATPIQVRCWADPAFGFQVQNNPAPADADYGAVVAVVAGQYQNKGGMSCSASSQVDAVNVPQRYMENQGFFHRPHWARGPIPVCGSGRATSGACTGHTGILLGDWALDGPLSDRVNSGLRYVRQGNDNAPFHDLVEAIWTADGTSRTRASSDFAAAVNGGTSPYDEDQFFISSPGYAGAYIDYTTQGLEVRDTTGIYNDISRGPCFLGRLSAPNCNSQPPIQDW